MATLLFSSLLLSRSSYGALPLQSGPRGFVQQEVMLG
jgi:hypothetical protein